MTSAAQGQALQAYLELCRDALRLDAWDLEVVVDVPNAAPEGLADALLNINPQPLRHYASLRVGTFFAADAQEQRQTVAHELYHLVQADLWWWLLEEGTWKLPLAPDHAQHLEERFRHELEVQADWVARLIEPLLPPMPPWPAE